MVHGRGNTMGRVHKGGVLRAHVHGTRNAAGWGMQMWLCTKVQCVQGGLHGGMHEGWMTHAGGVLPWGGQC